MMNKKGQEFSVEKLRAELNEYGYWILFTAVFLISFLCGIAVGLNHLNHAGM